MYEVGESTHGHNYTTPTFRQGYRGVRGGGFEGIASGALDTLLEWRGHQYVLERLLSRAS